MPKKVCSFCFNRMNTAAVFLLFKTEEVERMAIPCLTSLSDSSYARENISYPQTGNGITSARDGN